MICHVENCGTEMEHQEDVEAVHDPSASDGYGERRVHWLECPKCGHQEECDGCPEEQFEDDDDT